MFLTSFWLLRSEIRPHLRTIRFSQPSLILSFDITRKRLRRVANNERRAILIIAFELQKIQRVTAHEHVAVVCLSLRSRLNQDAVEVRSIERVHGVNGDGVFVHRQGSVVAAGGSVVRSDVAEMLPSDEYNALGGAKRKLTVGNHAGLRKRV